MGTVHIAVNSPEALTWLIHIMGQQYDGKDFPLRVRRQYDVAISAIIEGHKYGLLGYPRNPYIPHIGTFQAHFSHYGSFREVRIRLHEIWDPHFNDCMEAKLPRLDLWIDLAMGFDLIAQTISSPRARKHYKYESRDGKTLEIGKRDRVTVIYAKTKDAGAFDYYPPGAQIIAHDGTICGTRIEVRHYGKKVPIRCLREYPSLIAFNPFAHLRLRSTTESIVQGLSDTRSKTNGYAYLYLSQKVGAHQAKKELGINGNFERTIGKILQEFDVDLLEVYRGRMRRYLEIPAGEGAFRDDSGLRLLAEKP
jgi:hypothetical protein